MRQKIILVLLVVCAAPAAGQSVAPVAPAEPEIIHVPSVLRDPATVDRLADTMQSLSQVLLDVKVGKLQAALDGRKATPAEERMTVRDLARRKDPDFDRRLQQQIAAARPMMAQGIKVLNETLPAINHDLADAQKTVERAVANLPDPNYPKR